MADGGWGHEPSDATQRERTDEPALGIRWSTRKAGTMKRIAISATVAAMLVAVAGCSSDGNSDASTASAVAGSPKPGSAEIARFDVPESVQCAGATFTSVSVEYQTSGAARAELRVDGRPIPLDDPARGSVSADVRCDPLPHDFVLLAYDDRDGLTFEERLLDTVG